jgi:hypothetical protein
MERVHATLDPVKEKTEFMVLSFLWDKIGEWRD